MRDVGEGGGEFSVFAGRLIIRCAVENDGRHNDPCVRVMGYETLWVGNKGLGNRAVFMHEMYAWNDLCMELSMYGMI